MTKPSTRENLAQPFSLVKPGETAGSDTLSKMMIHHKEDTIIPPIILKNRNSSLPSPYGVSRNDRVLSPQLLIQKFDQVRDCLTYSLKLSTAQREVTLRLLRMWAYYGQVYPRECMITKEPGCSKATFWRVIARLRDIGLVTVVNRYVIRPHAQISNLYLLQGLILVIARYLAEHGHGFREKWLKPYMAMPGRIFWSLLFTPGVSISGGLPLDRL